MRVIIVGAGLIGCALAYRLAQTKGTDVTVIDAAPAPGHGASAASFGWINACFYADAAHFALRAAGIEAWRRLQQDAGLGTLTWSGALWWEAQGAELEQMQTDLSRLGYPAERLAQAEVAALEPALAAPPRAALLFPREGAVEGAESCAALLRAAQSHGAQALFGLRAEAIEPGAVITAQGRLEADEVIVASGTGAEALLATQGTALPMLARPGAILRTRPVPPLLAHILVTPAGEIRQMPDGALMMPTSVAHQADSTEQITEGLPALAEIALARLAGIVRTHEPLRWADVSLAWRPVPQDGLPAIGRITDGLSCAVMHSGATLAAISVEVLAALLLDRPSNATSLIAPYDPLRFGAA